jgi:choloylglycine hydrolase
MLKTLIVATTSFSFFLNLSSLAASDKNVGDMTFKPLGDGSGTIGLPGDNILPSRFIRAVAATQTARPTATGDETIYEHFRILDNFNLPSGGAAGAGETKSGGMRSATLGTSGYDTINLVMYYHTQSNRRGRRADLKRIDFKKSGGLVHLPLDKEN